MRDSLMPMLRLFMFQCFLTMLVALPFHANAQYRPGPAGQTVEVANINRYLYARDKIDVMRELKIERALRSGKQVISLSVQASSTEPNAKLVLKHNGQRIEVVNLDYFSTDKTLQVPINLQAQDKLVLVARRGSYISTVKATFAGQVNPGPANPGNGQVLRARIHQDTNYSETLRLRQLIRSHTGARLKGLRLKKVIVKANKRGYYGLAHAQLMINGAPVGLPQPLSSTEQRLVFDLPAYGMNVIGQDLRSIQLHVTGSAHIRMVGFKIEQQRMPRPGRGGYNQSVQVNVNRAFYGSQRVGLKDLLGHAPRVNMNAPVEALTIVARGQGNIMITGGGSALGAISVSGMYGSSETVRVMNYSTVGDIKLRVTGDITIESIRVKMGR